MYDRWEDWFHGDERLLWEGSPLPGIRHWVRNILLSLFGIPFFGGGLLCSGTGLAMLTNDFSILTLGAGLFLVCFGVPFLLVGGGLALGPWYTDVRAHEMVRYALSTRRGYIATRWWKRKMEVFDISPDQPVEVVNERDVFFHTTIGVDSDGDRKTEKKGFENIADVDRVYRLIRSIQADEEPGKN